MKYRLAIFDMDGTILDTLEDLTDSINYSLRECGFPERTLKEIRSFVGNGNLNSIRRSLPEGADEQTVKKAYGIFTGRYKDHCNDKTKPYPGVCGVISELRSKGVLTAVISNKDDYAVRTLVKAFFEGLFDFALGARPELKNKPAPDPVYAVLEKLGVEKKDAVYIGDSEVDLQTAQNSGLDCISVLWGFRDRDLLEERGAKTFAAAPSELPELVCGK